MATFIVTNANASGAGSLASAILQAEAAAGTDTITFSGVSVLRPTAPFTLTTSIVFDGDLNNDGIADVTISGDTNANGTGDHALFRLDPTANVKFDGMILRDGSSSSVSAQPVAGAILNYGKATIVNSQFINNRAEAADGAPGGQGADGGDGGSAAGAIYNGGTLSITDTVFSSGSAISGRGGNGGHGAAGGAFGGDGGDGGNSGHAAAGVINAVGGTMSLSAVDFGGGSASLAGGGDGGNGGSGLVGGDGGDGGDGGFATLRFINFGSASGSFITSSGGSGGGVGAGAPGTGGAGSKSGGSDGQPGFGSVTALSLGVTVGTAGDDVRAGLNGNEYIRGLGGNDKLSGGAGGDSLAGDAGNDTLDGGSGNDNLNGGEGDDVLKASVGEDVYSGGDGTDTLDFSAIAQPVTVDLGANSAQAILGGSVTISQIENVVGTKGADMLTGTAGDNIISDGGGAGDTLQGLGGNDTYRIGNGGAVIIEAAGGGNDTVVASVDYALKAGTQVELLRTNSSAGTAAIDLTGNELGQTIIGNAGNNTLRDGGGAGIDTLRGLGGNDTYGIDNSGALIVEASDGGNDLALASVDYVLKSGVELEMLRTNLDTGKAAIDLTGNALKQTIRGNAGSNKLDGKGGNDVLWGLGGKDFFVFSSTLGSGNTDTIADFNVVDDTIRLQNAVFTKLSTTGALSSSSFRASSAGTAADSDDFILYDTDNGRLYYDADGNGSGARIHFATLTGAPAITNADFVVI